VGPCPASTHPADHQATHDYRYCYKTGKPDLLEILQLDVTDQASVDQAIQHVSKRSDQIDVVVNNAGIHTLSAFEDLPEAALHYIMETNFFGPLRVTRAVLPLMLAQHSGVIVIVTGLSGFIGMPGETAYTASKFALEGAAESLQYEVERFGIRIAFDIVKEAGYTPTQLVLATPTRQGLVEGTRPRGRGDDIARVKLTCAADGVHVKSEYGGPSLSGARNQKFPEYFYERFVATADALHRHKPYVPPDSMQKSARALTSSFRICNGLHGL